jgi:hypothetical protein
MNEIKIPDCYSTAIVVPILHGLLASGHYTCAQGHFVEIAGLPKAALDAAHIAHAMHDILQARIDEYIEDEMDSVHP